MWNHFIYKQQQSKFLEQGDVLKKTGDLVALLEKYHPHYAQHPENRFFAILTQSCDLVVRDGTCNARYVTLAPVRSLAHVVEKEFRQQLTSKEGAPAYGSFRVKADVERFLARLFNNNESAYFFFDSEALAGITEPMCALLELPIALKIEHASIFNAAKIIGINDAFQAKLGWLLGQLYSRVGTQDYPEIELDEKVERVVDELAVWLEVDAIKPLTEKIDEYLAANQQTVLDRGGINSIIQGLPKKKAAVIDRVLDLGTEQNLYQTPSPQRFQFRTKMQNDPKLAALLK